MLLIFAKKYIPKRKHKNKNFHKIYISELNVLDFLCTDLFKQGNFVSHR